MDLVASILFRHDLKLLQAPDAKLGIELAKAHQPDLILMDINLPGMDGYEALKIIRSEPSLGSTPVIAISANCLDSDIKKGLAAGFNEYVSKPIQITSFLKKINSPGQFNGRTGLSSSLVISDYEYEELNQQYEKVSK